MIFTYLHKYSKLPSQIHLPFQSNRKEEEKKIRNLIVIVIAMQVFRFGDQLSKLAGNHI